MKGYSQRIADRLNSESGHRVELAPLNIVSPYIIDGHIGASDAADVRRIIKELDGREERDIQWQEELTELNKGRKRK